MPIFGARGILAEETNLGSMIGVGEHTMCGRAWHSETPDQMWGRMFGMKLPVRLKTQELS